MEEQNNELKQVFARFQETAAKTDDNGRLEKENKLKEQEKIYRVVRSNETANVPKRFWKVRFSDFADDFTEKAKELCLDKNTDHILLLYGNTGCGKTTLMCSAIHERAFNGYMGSMYYSMLNFEMDLWKCRNFQTEDDEKKFIEDLASVPFLCIDEVGVCSNRKEESYFLQRIICMRYDNMLPTWISTNLRISQFKALICNIDLSNKSPEECKEICNNLDKENAVLNRIKSVIITHPMVGNSFREVNSDGRNNH